MALVRTTAAISRATSAGPNACESATTWVAAVQPTARAARSCSTASASPSVITEAPGPSAAAAICTASSTAHSSWALIVKPANRPSTPWASSVSTTSLEESTTLFTQTSTDMAHRIRSLRGSNSAVASIEPTVTG